jgi:hypothetical protein
MKMPRYFVVFARGEKRREHMDVRRAHLKHIYEQTTHNYVFQMPRGQMREKKEGWFRSYRGLEGQKTDICFQVCDFEKTEERRHECYLL